MMIIGEGLGQAFLKSQCGRILYPPQVALRSKVLELVAVGDAHGFKFFDKLVSIIYFSG